MIHLLNLPLVHIAQFTGYAWYDDGSSGLTTDSGPSCAHEPRLTEPPSPGRMASEDYDG